MAEKPPASDSPDTCPVKGCDVEKTASRLYQHVLQTDGKGHGPKPEIPESLNEDYFESSESPTEPGSADDEMTRYARFCPYCQTTHRGIDELMTHLVQEASSDKHLSDAVEKHDGSEFPVVKVKETIVDIVEEEQATPSEAGDERRINKKEQAFRYIADLYSEGKSEEAARARERLLDY